MGCTQSKTNEQEVVDPNVDPVEVTDAVPTHVVDSAAVETEVLPTKEATPIAEAEVEPVPIKEANAVEVKTSIQALQFVPGKVSFNEYGVAFYNFDGSNPADPCQEVHVCKRYSEFKAMHREVAKLMASEKNVKPDQQDKFQTYPALPSMPPANAVTFVLGRGNQKVVDEREAQFVRILNAISRHPIAFQSKPFTEFMA